MRVELPGWVIDNDASVRAEVAALAGASMAERWEATRRCCRAAMRMLRFHENRAAALARRDPLPESALRALDRLRR